MEKKIGLGKRYFLRMRPMRSLPFIGWRFTSSNDLDPWVECEVVKSKDPNIITLQALEDGYGIKTFCGIYFQSYLDSGLIIEKTRQNQHVEFIKWSEPLTSTVCIEHSGFIVI